MGIEVPPQAAEAKTMQELEISEYILQNGKCCACEGILKGSHLNIVILSKIATWEYPAWENIFDKNRTALKYACAIVCDNCVNEQTGEILTPIKYAMDVGGTPRRIVYYKVEDLEDGEPDLELDPAEATALGVFTHLENIEDLRTAVALRDAEEINEVMLKQSAYYLMLISNSYINAIQDPTDPQHFDFIRQIEVAQSGKKPTVVIYDETVSEEDKEKAAYFLRNLDVRKVMTHDFTKEDDELAKKVGEILKEFEAEEKDV